MTEKSPRRIFLAAKSATKLILKNRDNSAGKARKTKKRGTRVVPKINGLSGTVTAQRKSEKFGSSHRILRL